MTDKQLAEAAVKLFALTQTCKYDDDVQDKCWSFIFDNMEAILRLALIGSQMSETK